jgi:NTP pyrophosphatase (non-canonical NTP hydrolase)
MKPRLREILVIAQEEAAEVIQAISKCFRFGVDADHQSGTSQCEHLENEIADFLVMVDLLKEEGIVSDINLAAAKERKIKKLQVWSDIYRS